MSERPKMDEAEQQASRWIARLDASDVTLDDHQRFRAWLDASPVNRAAYEAVSGTWDRFDALKLDPALAIPAARPLLSRRTLLAGAGGLAVMTTAGATLFAWSQPVYAASFETPVGGREQARLGDGSEVELNAATALEARFTNSVRQTTLHRGEALFNIISDRRPFTVVTAFGSLTAERASFAVRLTPAAARVSVFSGELFAEARAGERVSAGTRQELVLAGRDATRTALDERHAANRVAWREGMLAFDGDPLSEAVIEVSRQTGVGFEFADAALADLRVGGYIRATDLDAFVALLEQNLDVTATRSGDTILLSR